MKYFNWFKNKIKERLSFGSEPDFFIVGAQKCGTTSLYYYIEKYALNFRTPIDKELYFFSENYHKGLNYYRAKFPIFKFNKLTGEATPDYIYYHRAPDLIKKDFPNSKIVIVLRDPAERAYSQYNHQNFTRKTIGYDPLSFSKAIREGRDRFHISPKSDFFHEYKYY
ncbi:sulfotransferase domain-containing protein, partial [Vibrio pomeroyi]